MTRAERVLEARRMSKAGEFDRAVIANEAYDLQWDKLTLACGHWTVWDGKLHPDPKPPAQVRCRTCAEAWIEASDGQER